MRTVRYEYPELTNGHDANWLRGEVELRAGLTGSFRAHHEVALRTDELERFRDQLRTLDAELTGEATLENLESQVGATVKLNAGKGTMAGFVREDIGAELCFDHVETDQSFVRQALREFDVLVRAFPVRGESWG